MSEYGYNPPEQSHYSGYAATSYPAVPQYTQSQINTYYEQYHQYPPQPYQVIADYSYVQPQVPVGTPTYTQQPTAPGYQQWQEGNLPTINEPPRLAVPLGKESLQRRESQKTDRRDRSTSRTRTWTCDLPNCTSTANFTRLADLQRHQSTVHGVGTPDFPCTVPQCTRIGEKGFTRRDHLVEHLRNFHHLDIPKRRPGERSANPLGLPNFQS